MFGNLFQQISRAVGNATGGLIGEADYQKSGPAPTPGEDPRITEQRKKLLGEAKEFRANLPKYTQERYRDVATLGHEALRDTNKLIRRNASRRGMFNSGMRLGQESGARGRLASMLASQRADINREAQDLAGAKEETAANVGLAGFDSAIQRSNNMYQQAMQQEMARRKAMGQLGQGVGYGLGAYFGNKEQTPTDVRFGSIVDESF